MTREEQRFLAYIATRKGEAELHRRGEELERRQSEGETFTEEEAAAFLQMPVDYFRCFHAAWLKGTAVVKLMRMN